jgi:hypothetical protein
VLQNPSASVGPYYWSLGVSAAPGIGVTQVGFEIDGMYSLVPTSNPAVDVGDSLFDPEFSAHDASFFGAGRGIFIIYSLPGRSLAESPLPIGTFVSNSKLAAPAGPVALALNAESFGVDNLTDQNFNPILDFALHVVPEPSSAPALAACVLLGVFVIARLRETAA